MEPLNLKESLMKSLNRSNQRRIVLTSAVLAATALAWGLGATNAFASGAVVGQAAPNFSLKDVNGKTVSLADFKGKPVVLEWVNPGCPFVKKHYANPGNMQGLQKESGTQAVAWLAINSTEPGHGDYMEPAKLAAWYKSNGGSPTAVLMDADGTVGKAYGARTTPHMYVIDAAGKLAYVGAIDSIPSAKVDDIAKANNYVRAALTDIKANKAVATPSSNPYGCSVKYKS
jgi:AhpC/TSA family